MSTATSADGTTIGYQTVGSGPAIVLVDGAFCSRAFGPMPDLAKLLADRFTVYTYDRRGRGESGDTAPYAVEREIEDLEAVIDAAGGRAHVHGTSSGAVLSARATAALPGKVSRLSLYEPPLVTEASRPLPPADYREQLDRMIADGRNGDAVTFFMTRMVGAPALAAIFVRLMPVGKKLKAVAPTLRYDLAVLGDSQRGTGLPAELAGALASIGVPTLVADGGKSPAWMHVAADTVAATLPRAERQTLPNQTHQVQAAVIAPVLAAFHIEAG